MARSFPFCMNQVDKNSNVSQVRLIFRAFWLLTDKPEVTYSFSF